MSKIYADQIPDYDKSVMLALLMGCRLETVKGDLLPYPFPDGRIPGFVVVTFPDGYGLCFDNNSKSDQNFYSPYLMHVAWRVLNWAMGNTPFRVRFNEMWLCSMIHTVPHAEAQRLWLDRVLELASDAGMLDIAHMKEVEK